MDASFINPLSIVRHTIEPKRREQVRNYACIEAVHIVGRVFIPPLNADYRSHRSVRYALKITLIVNDRMNGFQADKDAICAFS